MLDAFRIWPHILARLRAGPLGPHLDGFVEALETAGYTPRGIRRHLQAVDKFGAWLRRHRLRATEVDEATVARFVAGLGRYPSPSRPRGRLPDPGFGVRRLAAWLWQQGLAARRAVEPPVTDADRWLRAFDGYLDRVTGLAVGTRRLYLRYARAFLALRFGAAPPDWTRLRAEDVADFVRAQAARLKPSACRLPVTATRAVLRFLATTGAVRAGLEGAVPTVRQWKHAALPGPLTAPEMARVLAGCSGASAVRRRDRAIVLLLARLGLRAGEVAALGLDDLDWRAGRLRVRASKSRRERALPLPAEAGRALVAYLRRGRPRGSDRAVFLRARAPVRPLTASGVSTVAHRALARAGVAVAPAGAHALRHTAATEMVRRGATFKEVADVLGHAHLQTTAIYAKLDVETLARVALPWPGGAP